MADAGHLLPDDPNALFEHAPCGLLVTGDDGTIRRVNATFCAWTGRRADDLVNRLRLADLLTMGGRVFLQTHWAPLMAMQGSVAEVKLELLHSDGRRLPMLLNAVRHGGDGGPAWHAVAAVIVNDRHLYERELLAARHKAESALERLSASEHALRAAQAEAAGRARFAEQMVGIVSHDLRNPLSAVLMSAYALGRTDLSTNQMRAVSRIVSASNRAQRLIADLLDFTQARMGRGLAVQRKDIDLHELAALACDELRTAFPGRELRHLRSGEGLSPADPDRLTQLLGNLVANAFTYGAPDQPVTVSTEVLPAACRIGVHNHGTPIPDALRDGLFEPMSRGEEESAQGGVGLGLFIVREIARAHGGEVAVASDAPGGTRFTITLPR
jgi:sigma-B regulation protein RsbU (phosphoserine phosphatase)